MVGMIRRRWQNKQMIAMYTEIKARWTWNQNINKKDSLVTSRFRIAVIEKGTSPWIRCGSASRCLFSNLKADLKSSLLLLFVCSSESSLRHRLPVEIKDIFWFPHSSVSVTVTLCHYFTIVSMQPRSTLDNWTHAKPHCGANPRPMGNFLPENSRVASDKNGKWKQDLKEKECQADVKPDIGEALSEM